MSFRQKHDSGNRAVAMLASFFVVLGGAATCAAIVLSAGKENAETALLSIAGATVAMLTLLWLLCGRPPESRMKTGWSWLAGRPRRRIPYRVRAKLRPSERVSSPPAPPTVETIRAITGRQGTWVPAPGAPPQAPVVDGPPKA
jgi:hypothetical protein